MRPKWRFYCGGGIALAAFVIFLLPFLLPLGGPDVLPLDSLIDENGAFTVVNGAQLYFVHEDGAGESVIFLHGYGGSSVDYRPMLTNLDGYDRYALDLPGFGLSQKGLDLDMSGQSLADAVAGFMASQGIDQAHIVAHDLGGNVALHLVENHPQRVQSVTLIAASIQTEATTPIPDALFDLPFLQRWARILLRAIIPKSNEIDLRSAIARDEVITAEVIASRERAFHTPDWDLALLALARDSSQSALGHPLNTINVPVLIVWGDADGWIAPQTAYDLESEIPGAAVVMLPEVGHIPMLEAPNALRDALIDFWRNIK
jgi:pimeloyl-ACP methyl ester carboxylesterase